ncbi:MAG: protein-disulfide reductase DsbD [Acidiferrobacter sp.]
MDAVNSGCAPFHEMHEPSIDRVRSNPRIRRGWGLRLWAGVLMVLGLGACVQAALLPPNQAFRFTAALAAHHRVDVRWVVAPGYHLYRDHVHLKIGPASVVVSPYRLPAGRILTLPGLGGVLVYFKSVALTLHYHFSGAAPAALSVVSRYQGCADTGICYPPLTTTVTLPLPPPTVPRVNGAQSPLPTNAAKSHVQGPPTRSLQPAKTVTNHGFYATALQGHIWLTLGLFFVLGIGLTFTPCVFPMIPILSALIVGQGDGGDNSRQARGRAFRLSLAYIGGMALTYTGAGVLAALSGSYLAAIFQNPWVLGLFSIVFVLLSLSMFGFYELQLPAVIRNRFLAVGRGGHLVGSFVMGALAVLIVSPCIAAPLAGALLYISQTGNVVLGGGALLALSLGMGLPLLIIGTSAGHLLPRAGRWMDTVKAVFGVLLLGVAILLISRIIPGPATLALWAVLAMIVAVYVGAFDSVAPGISGWRRLGKGAGLVLFAYGLALGSGALLGGSNIRAPWHQLRSFSGTHARAPVSAFRTVTSLSAFQAALTAARGRPVLVDFWATWCLDCKAMDTVTFASPRVQQMLATMALIRVDVTQHNAATQRVLHKFGLFGPPAILLFNAKGRLAGRYPGYEGPTTLLRRLDAVRG